MTESSRPGAAIHPSGRKPGLAAAPKEDFEQTLSRADSEIGERAQKAPEQPESADVVDEQSEADGEQQVESNAPEADVEPDTAEANASAPTTSSVTLPTAAPKLDQQIVAVQPAETSSAAEVVTQEQGNPAKTQPAAQSTPAASASTTSTAPVPAMPTSESVRKQPVEVQPGQMTSVQPGVTQPAREPTLPALHAADQPAAPAQDEPIDPNVSRVARGLQSALSQQGGSVTLRLQPAELGQVRIDVTIRDGVVRAEFQTQHESVRSLLQHQLGHLRHALESQGLVVDRLDVQAQPQSQDTGAERQGLGEEAGQGRSRGRRDQTGEQGERGGQAGGAETFAQALVNVVG